MSHFCNKFSHIIKSIGFPGGSVGKESTCNAGDMGLIPLWGRSGKTPWRSKWQPTLVFLPGKSWTEQPGRLQFMGLQRVWHHLVTKPPLFLFSSTLVLGMSLSPPTAKSKCFFFLNYEDFQFHILIVNILYIFSCHIYCCLLLPVLNMLISIAIVIK